MSEELVMPEQLMRWDVINNLIEQFGFEYYLEVGTAEHGCFDRVICKYKIGMDPAYPAMTKDTEIIFQMTSDEFFAQQKAKYNIAFIDGLHLFEQATRDIINVWNALLPGGFIILHDCFPCNVSAAGRIPLSPYAAWNGDVYRAILWFKDQYPNIYCKVIKTDHGLGTIYKEEDSILPLDMFNLLSYLDYDYDWLMANLDKIGLSDKKELDRLIQEIKEKKK